MKYLRPYLLTVILFLLTPTSNSSQTTNDKYEDWEKLKCRVTYYHPYQDKWGDQVAHPKVDRAKEGVTVAAHPTFDFGTDIYIPALEGVVGDGYFKVQDRGGAVTSKKASRGKAYVFDVFIRTKNKYYTMRRNPEYMWVYIQRDGD